MKASEKCKECMLQKQYKRIENKSDENKKKLFIEETKRIIDEYSKTESAPELTVRVDNSFKSYFGNIDEFKEAKEKYNALLLSKEAEIESLILSKNDSLKEAIKYVCASNYIDFSAVENVNEKTFSELLKKAETEKVDEKEYSFFKNDLEKASSLVYLTDNCGEIVIDKIFIRLIKKAYPKLQLTVILRGGNVLNDATLKDAESIGLTKEATCIGSGNSAPGTILGLLSKEAKNKLLNADVIISKGQGNFESLFKEGLNPYYLFLCKCDLFTERFGLEKFSSVFKKEERIGKLKI